MSTTDSTTNRPRPKASLGLGAILAFLCFAQFTVFLNVSHKMVPLRVNIRKVRRLIAADVNNQNARVHIVQRAEEKYAVEDSQLQKGGSA